MDIVEEAHRAREKVSLSRPDSAFEEFKRILERNFDEVVQEDHVKKRNSESAEYKTTRELDRFTVERMDIRADFDYEKDVLQLQVRAKLVTEYPDNFRYQKTLMYYAYRTLYDKFLYGNAREGFIPEVKDKTDQILHEAKDRLEA